MPTPSPVTTEPAGTQNADTDVLDGVAAGSLLIRGGTLRILSYAGMIALSVGSTAVLTRDLGVVRFGEYTTVLSLAGIVTAITDAGMSNVGIREYALRVGSDRDGFIRDLLGLRIVLTLVGTMLAAAFAVAAGYDTALLLGTVAAGLAIVALAVQHTYSIPLYTRLRLGTISALELGRQAMWVAGLIALAAAGAGVLPLLAMMLLAYAMFVLPTAWLTKGQIPLRIRLKPRSWRALWAPTALFSLASAVGTLYLYAAQVLTSLITDHHQSGVFAASFRVFMTTTGVPALLGSAALPLLSRAARDNSERLADLTRRFLVVSLAGGIAAALVLSAGAPFVISVVAGPKYAQAQTVLEIQSFALIGTFVAMPVSLGLLSLGLFRQLLVGNGAALVSTFAATAVLAKVDGAQGAAIANVIGESVLATTLLVGLARSGPRHLIDGRRVAKLLAAGACSLALALTLGIPSLPRAIATGTLFGAMVIILKAIPPDIVNALTVWRRSR